MRKLQDRGNNQQAKDRLLSKNAFGDLVHFLKRNKTGFYPMPYHSLVDWRLTFNLGLIQFIYLLFVIFATRSLLLRLCLKRFSLLHEVMKIASLGHEDSSCIILDPLCNFIFYIFIFSLSPVHQ